jgi:hypothetical protein
MTEPTGPVTLEPWRTGAGELPADQAPDPAVAGRSEEDIDLSGTGGRPAGLEELPETGDARVDDALGRLADLTALPVTEHLAVYEDVQRRLHEALADLDER